MEKSVKKLALMDMKVKDICTSILVSENQNVCCYTGVLSKDEKIFSLRSLSYIYADKKLKDILKQIRGLFRIDKGCVVLQEFGDDSFYLEPCLYQKLNLVLRFPTTLNSGFGVFNNIEDWDLNEEITREVFGLTYSELSDFLLKYSQIIGIHSEYSSYPTITRSTTRDNFCDLTGHWIPKEFPYIKFAPNQCDFDHVSLWGFYRFIKMLTNNNIDFPIAKMFIEQGIDKEVLNRIIEFMDVEAFYSRIERSQCT